MPNGCRRRHNPGFPQHLLKTYARRKGSGIKRLAAHNTTVTTTHTHGVPSSALATFPIMTHSATINPSSSIWLSR